LTFSETLDQLPASALWEIKEYSSPSDLSSILIAALTNGTAHAISDGSFIDKFGTLAFTIVDDHISSIIGLNVVPRHLGDQSAYRSELAGLYVIVLAANLHALGLTLQREQ
jgi:hypothetical protein